MIGDSSLFITFQSHPATLTDGSTSCVLRSWTIHPTPLITFTSVLSLSQFYFNLISVSKLIHTLNCSISFILNHCLIQDLSTKHIMGRGRESRGLYILETEVSKSVAYSGVVTPLKLHCCLGHLSLPLLKKIYPRFSSLSSLNCESCQYVKLHRVHLGPKVNKRALLLLS